MAGTPVLKVLPYSWKWVKIIDSIEEIYGFIACISMKYLFPWHMSTIIINIEDMMGSDNTKRVD